jgi:hypothetical protein
VSSIAYFEEIVTYGDIVAGNHFQGSGIINEKGGGIAAALMILDWFNSENAGGRMPQAQPDPPLCSCW